MKNKTLVVQFVLFLFLSFLLVSCGQQKTKWKGMIEEENGITVVKNPKEPMYGEDIFMLEEELSIGVAEGAEEYMFLDAREVVVDNRERIFVSDRRGLHIKVFDKFGNHITTIGRKGQGPGEFSQITNIQITPRNELMVYGRNAFKLTFFSLDGDYIRTVLLKGIQALRISENARDNYFVSTIEFQGQYGTNTFRAAREVKEYGSDFAFIKTIAKDKFWNQNAPLQPSMASKFLPSGSIVCGFRENYEFQILDSEGKIVRKVSRDFDPIEISEEEKVKRHLPQINELPRYFPAFQAFFSVDEEGRIYAQTFERQRAEDKFFYDVFDPEGKYAAKVQLNALPLYWKNSKMYSIEEDKDGFQLIKRYKVTWKINLQYTRHGG